LMSNRANFLFPTQAKRQIKIPLQQMMVFTLQKYKVSGMQLINA